jgi:hypothetical protein
MLFLDLFSDPRSSAADYFLSLSGTSGWPDAAALMQGLP